FCMDDDKAVVESDGIHWHFVGVVLLNTLWLSLWDDNLLFLSWIVILIIACQITVIYQTLNEHYPPPEGRILDKLFIQLPFTLYHAWIVIVAVLTTFATITPEKTYHHVTENNTTIEVADSPTIVVQLVVILGLIFLETTAVAYIEKREDWAGAAVMAWTLYGIWYGQEDPVIHWAALILAVIATIYLFKPLVVGFFKNKDEKSIP
ncbi:11977_t:CDS:2, partial [Racocetra persica]